MDDMRLPICAELLDTGGDLKPFDFCAPIFIASAFSGTLLARDEQLVFTKFDDRSIRSGTVTFIKYKGECIALTCKHVAVQYFIVPGKTLAEQPDRFSKWFLDPKFPGFDWKVLRDGGFEANWGHFDEG